MTARKPYVVNGIRFRGLLSYTVVRLLSERPYHRDELISKLWGLCEPEDTDKELRALLSRVRCAIEPHGYTISNKWKRGEKSVFSLEGK